MYQVIMKDANGNETTWFQIDNQAVWTLLVGACRNDPQAWAHIQLFQALQNGRDAWLALIAVYEGEGEESRREKEAKAVIENPGRHRFIGERREGDWRRYVSHLVGEYNVLKASGRQILERDQVERLLAGIDN